MNILQDQSKNGTAGGLGTGRGKLYLPLLLLTLVVSGSLVFGGYLLGHSTRQSVIHETDAIAPSGYQPAVELSDIQELQQSVDLHLNALALRLGQLQAQMIRLNALGRRLTKMAEIDTGEFNFSELPPSGGPADSVQAGYTTASELLRDLERLSREMKDRERQLTVIDTLLMSRDVHDQVSPAGRPITSGWTSSYYGTRRDPFNGRREFHRGIDFAGKRGSDVIAVAAGVVILSGVKAGYGNLVEIDHGNGYVTRYAHNGRNLVKSGQRVTKGQRIALMGSTGHSTGPHVHFEVLYNGERVNPTRYIKAGG